MNTDNYSTINQVQGHSRVSDRYAFIPTSRVLAVLADYGFKPSGVIESSTRKIENKGFQKHSVRLRSTDIIPQLNEDFPEIVLTNSHMGTAAYEIMIGWFKKICGNGLIVKSGNSPVFKILHKGYADSLVEQATKSILEMIPQLSESVQAMKQISLSRPEQEVFASSVVDMAWDGSGYSVPVNEVLRARRYDDSHSDLWNTFNRVQESVIRGGVRQTRADGSRVRSRAVNSIDRNVNLNKAMWSLAERMKEIKLAG